MCSSRRLDRAVIVGRECVWKNLATSPFDFFFPFRFPPYEWKQENFCWHNSYYKRDEWRKTNKNNKNSSHLSFLYEVHEWFLFLFYFFFCCCLYFFETHNEANQTCEKCRNERLLSCTSIGNGKKFFLILFFYVFFFISLHSNESHSTQPTWKLSALATHHHKFHMTPNNMTEQRDAIFQHGLTHLLCTINLIIYTCNATKKKNRKIFSQREWDY